MDLNEIQYFKYVADLGSFSRAARETKIPKSTLSRKVADLEKRLGVTLLRRTTRQVKLTEVGLEFLQRCSRILNELEHASAETLRSEEKPQGKLRITGPVDIGVYFLGEVATEFTRKYPDVELEFILDDQFIDLMEEKIDIAIRAGSLQDSSLKAQKLGVSEFQLFASPAYLKKHGEPKSVKDLENHCCILFSNLDSDRIWSLTSGSSKQSVKLKRVMSANQLSMVRTLAMQGAGIALIPVFIALPEEQKKLLARVLKGWGTDREPVHAVYPDQAYLPQRTRLFLEFLKKAFKAQE